MRASSIVFLFCFLCALFSGAFAWGYAFLFSFIPSGLISQQVTDKFLFPLQVLFFLSLFGAIISLVVWIRGANQPSEYYY